MCNQSYKTYAKRLQRWKVASLTLATTKYLKGLLPKISQKLEADISTNSEIKAFNNYPTKV